MIGYAELLSCWRRGVKNGNWYQLRAMDRIFYRAVALYAKVKNKITNSKIIAQLRNMVERLKTTIRRKMMNIRMERAEELLTRFQ